MNFNDHSRLVGTHAVLSCSQPFWLKDDEKALKERFKSSIAAQRGTELHELAQRLITMKVKLPNNNKTLNSYVNDAIGFGMKPEQVLYYSDNIYGTADSIIFSKDLLRIHDLKTGVTKPHIEQLELYAALFCLEYKVKPGLIGFELRIYQNDNKEIFNPTAEDILPIMDRIITADKIIEKLKGEL